MKILFKKDVADETVQRIMRLTPTSKPQWGTMTATEMLHHCQAANKNILEGIPDGKKSTLKQMAIKLVFMYIKKQLPQNIKGPSRIDARKSNILDAQFDEKKELLLETIQLLSERIEPIEATHPFFGKLNKKEWGIFAWKHLDHHLRQFGV